MAYTKNYIIDFNPSGTTVKVGIQYCDDNIDDLVSNLNTHEALTTACHGVGTGSVVGSHLTQSLYNKTLSAPTITGTVTASGATISSPTISGGTIQSPTLTGTVSASGATITAPTIQNATISNSTIRTPTLTGVVTASGATITGGTTVNQTISSPTISVGSDADGDIYYRSSSKIARVGKGSAGQSLKMNSGGTAPTWDSPLVSSSVQNASGTYIDFTGIPSWVKRITINFMGISLSGTATPIVQIGTGSGIEASSYLGAAGSIVDTASYSAVSTTGFSFYYGAAANVIHGTMVLTLGDSSSNKWVASGVTGLSSGAAVSMSGGSKALSGTLDRVRITNTGSDTFDAGSFSILYE